MAKYHIKKDGTPGICKAKLSCPLGDSNHHYDSIEEAQQVADKQNKQKFSQPQGHRRNKRRYTKCASKDRFIIFSGVLIHNLLSSKAP